MRNAIFFVYQYQLPIRISITSITCCYCHILYSCHFDFILILLGQNCTVKKSCSMLPKKLQTTLHRKVLWNVVLIFLGKKYCLNTPRWKYCTGKNLDFEETSSKLLADHDLFTTPREFLLIWEKKKWLIFGSYPPPSQSNQYFFQQVRKGLGMYRNFMRRNFMYDKDIVWYETVM